MHKTLHFLHVHPVPIYLTPSWVSGHTALFGQIALEGYILANYVCLCTMYIMYTRWYFCVESVHIRVSDICKGHGHGSLSRKQLSIWSQRNELRWTAMRAGDRLMCGAQARPWLNDAEVPTRRGVIADVSSCQFCGSAMWSIYGHSRLWHIFIVVKFLVDRTATSMIGYWHHDVVCLSVGPSVTLYMLWRSWSAYRAKSSTIVFLAGNFLFTSSDTFAVGCIV